MAKFIFKDKFLVQIDNIDEQIDGLLALKAELLLKEVELDKPEYIRLLKLRHHMTFEVKDRGIMLQLNQICGDKTKIRFIQSKRKFALDEALFKFVPGNYVEDKRWEERIRRSKDREQRALEKARRRG